MRTQTGWLRQVAAVAVVAGLALAQSVVAANRFVSNDGTWKMRDAFGEELPGTCYTLLAAALSNSSDTVIYVKNDYDCSADTPMSMDGTLNARYLLSSYRVTIRAAAAAYSVARTSTR